MKVLILSDIHSNIDGLKAVWEQEKDSDLILCAGDHVDWGFYPHEVIEWVKEHNVVCVAGNHDHEILEAIDAGRTFPTDGTPYDFQQYTIGHMTEEDVAFLRALPDSRFLSIDGLQIFMSHFPSDHGVDEHACQKTLQNFSTVGWCDREWEISTSHPASHFEKRVFLYGHTHQCQILQPGCGYQIVNPGSVSYRVGADSIAKGADYIVLENGFFTPKHVDYPVEHLYNVIKAQNFDLTKDIFRPAYIYYGVQS